LNARFAVRSFAKAAHATTVAVSLWLPAYAEDPDAAPAALSCLGCHAGEDGQENTQLSEPASLRRFESSEIASLLRDYRKGKRSGSVMNRIAAGLKDGEIEEIAGFLGKRP
jgi:cytochrome c553